MKKLFLVTAMASLAFASATKAQDSNVEAVIETPTQIETVVDEVVAPENIEETTAETIVEETIAEEAVVETMPPLAMNDRPIVVLFYADWCGSCKILEPRLNAAMAQLDDQYTLKTIRFDLTDETTTAKSAALAGENGLTDLYNDNAPKTGFALLVNKGKADEIALTKSDSIAEIKAKLEGFIAASKL